MNEKDFPTVNFDKIHEIEAKIHSQQLYDPTSPELAKYQLLCLDKLYEYNATRPTEQEKRKKILKDLFSEIGEGCYIEPPLYANFACKNVKFGKNVYANFGLTLVDDTFITVGDCTLFGPHVTLATAGHPIEPNRRAKGYQYNAPIVIGKNCWLGAGVIVMPGVTIGEGSVIGAGSIVTKDIPPYVVAYGNPCKVMRPIGERDEIYYFKDKKISDCDL